MSMIIIGDFDESERVHGAFNRGRVERTTEKLAFRTFTRVNIFLKQLAILKI